MASGRGRGRGRASCRASFTLALAAAAVLGGFGCRDSGAGVGATDGGHDAATSDHPGVVDADCPADGPGGGVCPITSCGYLKSAKTLGLTETLQSGADSLCNQGRICLATAVTAAGDAIALTCVAPLATGLGYGAACSPDPAGAQRCLDDSLCVGAPGTAGAPFFCTTLCRIDADCPIDSVCLEYPHPLPNGSSALVGQCTPIADLTDPICVAERNCPAGQGCVRAGDRTSVRVCKPGPGAKSLGDSCTAPADCRSGECYDREFRVGVTGNRALCSGLCTRNSDCGADQRCVAKVVGNNGTIDDPLDDVVVGYCRSLFASPITAACQSDAACLGAGLGADTCHPTYGTCYKAAAVIGGACSSDDGCGLGQACAKGPTFVGGACVLEGCAPARAGGATDVCPGARSVCSQRASDAPLYRCYEGCATLTSCSRIAQDYFCAAAQDGQPISICLTR